MMRHTDQATSGDEADILRAVPASGVINVIRVMQRASPIVKAGGRAFDDPSDGAVADRYYEALQGLLRTGYVREISRTASVSQYLLTDRGMETAAALKKG